MELWCDTSKSGLPFTVRYILMPNQFLMLTGHLPFDDDPNNRDSEAALLRKYMVSKPLKVPHYVTPRAANLLRSLLDPNPWSRIELSEILQHEWLKDGISKSADLESFSHSVEDVKVGVPSTSDI